MGVFRPALTPSSPRKNRIFPRKNACIFACTELRTLFPSFFAKTAYYQRLRRVRSEFLGLFHGLDPCARLRSVCLCNTLRRYMPAERPHAISIKCKRKCMIIKAVRRCRRFLRTSRRGGGNELPRRVRNKGGARTNLDIQLWCYAPQLPPINTKKETLSWSPLHTTIQAVVDVQSTTDSPNSPARLRIPPVRRP